MSNAEMEGHLEERRKERRNRIGGEKEEKEMERREEHEKKNIGVKKRIKGESKTGKRWNPSDELFELREGHLEERGEIRFRQVNFLSHSSLGRFGSIWGLGENNQITLILQFRNHMLLLNLSGLLSYARLLGYTGKHL